MLSRQRIVLSMLYEAGGSLNKLDLIKLLFLLNEETKDLPRTAGLEFIPYHRGPYSFTLRHDIKGLEQSGLLVQATKNITITDAGIVEARETPNELVWSVTAILKRHAGRSTDELIDHVYSTYTWYTVNSKWIDRRAQTRPVAPIALYTTSYEGVHLDGLLDRLMRKGVQRLVDVRSNPVARRFGFHKSTLERICPKVGIEYVHIPEVGIPGAWRTDLETEGAYRALFERYEKEVLPAQGEVLEKLAALILEKPSAMMCKEANPRCCHRTTLANFLVEKTGLPVVDLGLEVTGGLF